MFYLIRNAYYMFLFFNISCAWNKMDMYTSMSNLYYPCVRFSLLTINLAPATWSDTLQWQTRVTFCSKHTNHLLKTRLSGCTRRSKRISPSLTNESHPPTSPACLSVIHIAANGTSNSLHTYAPILTQTNLVSTSIYFNIPTFCVFERLLLFGCSNIFTNIRSHVCLNLECLPLHACTLL